MDNPSKIHLFLHTYNCGKLKIDPAGFSESLALILPDDACDIYVFGFQELCSILDGAFYEEAHRHMININRVVLDCLKRKYADVTGLTTIALHHIGAIGMIAVTPFTSRIRDCRYAEASCGYWMSLLKGGVGLRLKYVYNGPPVELTFATTHLGANEGEYYYLRRANDIQTIMRLLDFGDGSSFLKPQNHTFFMGDLNFRTTKTAGVLPERSPVVELLELHSDQDDVREKIKRYLSKWDELTIGRGEGEILSGFDEAAIGFRPTYKFHIDTAIYNSKRSPLWCDRILYQSTYPLGDQPRVVKYDSNESYMRSDHRPVYLQIDIPRTSPELIIGPSGNLIILQSARPKSFVSTGLSQDAVDQVSGPTQIYMKRKPLDLLTQLVLRRLSDLGIGYGLWIGCTPRGRISLLVLLLFAWLGYLIS